jgi:hypothetical protein
MINLAKTNLASHQEISYCYVPVILATREAEIRRIVVQSQPRQIVRETLSQKKGWWNG